jgi:uncharacterized membrane protein HdeD (DUF308 family)
MSTMRTEPPEIPQDDARALGSLAGWRAAFALGLITLALGVVVIFRPTLSMNVIAVLLGVAMIVSGVFHVVRALDGQEHQRVWRSIIGVLSILAGLVLIRNLHLTLALIGLFIGFTWVIQGIGWLMEGFSSSSRRGAERAWPLIFGLISLAAGIVVIATPVSSVATLTVLMGIWLIVIGALEMYGGLVSRHGAPGRPGASRRGTTPVSVPGQRTDGADRGVADRDVADQGRVTGTRPTGRSVQG